MPVYEYTCKRCGYRFEMKQSFDSSSPRCPECEGKIEKVIHAISFFIKSSNPRGYDEAIEGK